MNRAMLPPTPDAPGSASEAVDEAGAAPGQKGVHDPTRHVDFEPQVPRCFKAETAAQNEEIPPKRQGHE